MGTQRNAQSAEEQVITTVRLSRETWERFGQIAEANYRTASQELRRLVEQHVADHATNGTPTPQSDGAGMEPDAAKAHEERARDPHES